MWKFDKDAVRKEIRDFWIRYDGLFNVEAIVAASKTEGSALYGLELDDGWEAIDFLEKVYGENNIGYSLAGVGLINDACASTYLN